MRRRSILKWTTLTTISIATVLVMFGNVHSQTQGGALQAFDKEGKPSGECPLKHTEVKAQVSGFLSRVTVTQDFENNFAEKIEAVYTFPLPQAAASRISPPSAPGVRAGHDISLEIDLDAGVPIVGVNSEETEVHQINEQRAVVRLKDRATIPNKDFLLTYRVAGSAINDAVLTHRSERGGFFTLILQPPQRVAAEDVMKC